MSATFFRFLGVWYFWFVCDSVYCLYLCDLCVFRVFFCSFIVFLLVLSRFLWYLVIFRYSPACFFCVIVFLRVFFCLWWHFLLISGSFCMFFCYRWFCWYFARVFSAWLCSCVLFSAFDGCFLVYLVVFVCVELIWVFPDFLDTICRSCVVSDLGICL